MEELRNGGLGMKEIKSKNVQNYVMDDMAWKVDLPRFLKEISECSTNVPYAASFRILAQVLNVLTERAIEINDPALNIIMLNLGLYEGAHDKNAGEVISKLRKLITDKQKIGDMNKNIELSDEELELLITGLHCIDECDYNVYSKTCTPWSEAKEIKETLRVKLIRAQLNV